MTDLAPLRQNNNGFTVRAVAANPTGTAATTVVAFVGAAVAPAAAITNLVTRGPVAPAVSTNIPAARATQTYAVLSNDTANGFTCKFLRRGIYRCCAWFATLASADVVPALTLDAIAADLTAVPLNSTIARVVAGGSRILTVAATADGRSISFDVPISQFDADTDTTGIVRLQCAATGGGAPTAAQLNLANITFDVQRLSDLKSRS